MFAQADCVRIPRPQENVQLKLIRSLPNGNEFVSYIDAIGEIDGERHLIDWKTTTSRYPEEPEGLMSLDPQLICYSWRCQGCGSSSNLQVHHIIRRNSLGNDEEENLITLCVICHRTAHRRLLHAPPSR